MTAKPLTNKQSQMLTFIRWFIDGKHYAPTYREIMIGMGLSSKSVVAYHLAALEQAGRIRRNPNKVRAIWLVE